jgi:hypothetical protein
LNIKWVRNFMAYTTNRTDGGILKFCGIMYILYPYRFKTNANLTHLVEC